MLLLLDLFSGAGGCSVGYARAGFEVIGVDHVNQPRYPFAFVQADALDVLERLASGKRWRGYRGRDFAAIHASPPCQRYSVASKSTASSLRHPDLIAVCRRLLIAIGRPWVIENVPGAPLANPVLLCGLMFRLKLFRHRLFEASHVIMVPEHPSHVGKRIGVQGFCTVAGGGNSGLRDRAGGKMVRRPPADGVEGWRQSMGIDWMTRNELSQAIPPAYTEHLGRQLGLLLS